MKIYCLRLVFAGGVWSSGLGSLFFRNVEKIFAQEVAPRFRPLIIMLINRQEFDFDQGR